MLANIRPATLFQRRRTILLAISVFFALAIFSLYRYTPPSRISEYFPQFKTTTAADPEKHANSVSLEELPEYNIRPYEAPYCAERFGRTYLEKLQNSTTSYCTPSSATNFTCFNNRIDDHRLDMFCFGRSAVFDAADKKFALGCEPRALTSNETAKGTPELTALGSYWYETGPRVIFDRSVKMDANIEARNSTANYTILLKREGAYNLWHCLMEIWSMTMSLDVLRTTQDPNEKAPFFTLGDAENTQIVILDEQDDGPYFDLWTLFAKRPVVRMKNIPESTNVENIIIPLAGASNPTWQGDWNVHSCQQSELLHTFTHRILDFYKIDAWAPREGDVVVTFVDRQKSRRLVDSPKYLEELKVKIPHLKIQTIDFAKLPFVEQLKIIRETDVLVGVHGAGLTHGMFLRESSVMVEILPEGLNHKGFRNLAGLAGNTYLSTHGSKVPEPHSKRNDWHAEDVFLEKDRFINLMEVAVKSLFNTGSRSYDIN
ncbi:hypothetical protein G7Y89_g9874 [Cudoniella acicularis]|uniref:EGF domain-specific O-linked N-acetylglucosamine transferase n=1 Tax=Cudoniella acicularis TaxID=354080 RepID=A0A8H4W1G8_9HELO|nr:hypothetical protein G7Y89_g9874 [Cudoniella acicularis]